jgi:uncharacterized membrane protein YgcG
MAIVAYKQPVTKGEIESIRGVDSSAVLATLMERNLITIRGRSKVVGRPLLYGTTPLFLENFALRHLEELPRAEELAVALRPEPKPSHDRAAGVGRRSHRHDGRHGHAGSGRGAVRGHTGDGGGGGARAASRGARENS